MIAYLVQENYAEAKLNMDRLGIFHPEVNAQRSSSQYIIKLYKGYFDCFTIRCVILTPKLLTSCRFMGYYSISASNLEDRALRKLQQKQREEVERQRMLENPDATASLTATRPQQTQVCIFELAWAKPLSDDPSKRLLSVCRVEKEWNEWENTGPSLGRYAECTSRIQ
jgi:hypothetical protein